MVANGDPIVSQFKIMTEKYMPKLQVINLLAATHSDQLKSGAYREQVSMAPNTALNPTQSLKHPRRNIIVYDDVIK